jgi:GAF domain-containing protein
MPEYPDRLVQAIRDLSHLMVSDEGLDATLERVITLAARTIPGCELASMTMLRNGRFATPVATGPIAVEVDRAQYRADAGPCVQAVRDRKVFRVNAVTDDPRWPEFNEAAASAGLSSSLSLPMAVEDKAVGALNLYAKVPGAFSEADEGTAVLFAEQAGVACLNAERYWSIYNINQQLEEALKTRDVIGQAKGILMASLKITDDQSFDLLRAASQRRNVKLRVLAEEVATTGELRED